eukprot:15107589-Ditylum_brightwellii.AAC.1
MEIHAPAFMLHPWTLRAWLGNLNYKGGHIKGTPPPKKTGVVQKGAKQECYLQFLARKGIGQYYT